MHNDPVQQDLLAWHAGQDRRALGRAFERLRHEWAPKVARFLALPLRAPQVAQALGDLLITLLGSDPAAPPRALAPAHHNNPAAYRATVLSRAMRDQRRREQALQRAHQRSVERDPPEDSEPMASVDEALLLAQYRHQVVHALPHLEVRRRVAVALVLSLAPLPAGWLDELARALGEPPDDVGLRVTAYLEDPESAELRVRVLQPRQALALAREAFRKTLERAIAELTDCLHKGHA